MNRSGASTVKEIIINYNQRRSGKDLGVSKYCSFVTDACRLLKGTSHNMKSRITGSSRLPKRNYVKFMLDGGH